jgi:hypothetical protein
VSFALSQADASGTVGTLFFEYKKLGLHNWLDMRQANLTLDGMKAGVRDSTAFILILTERVLASWFCQQEILTAIEEQKKIQLIVEQEKRFHPFDIAAWQKQAADGKDTREMVNQRGEKVKVHPKICKMVDDHLRDAVPYRRRDFEQEAMMRALCERNGVSLPQLPLVVSDGWGTDGEIVVYVICNMESAAEVLVEIKQSINQEVGNKVMFTNELAKATRVLVLLTAGLLELEPCVSDFEEVVRVDEANQTDRIVTMYSPELGWEFGATHSNSRIEKCLNDHEAIRVRARDEDGPSRHEFPAMIVSDVILRRR